MKKRVLTVMAVMLMVSLTACKDNRQNVSKNDAEERIKESSHTAEAVEDRYTIPDNHFPKELAQIPNEYFTESGQQGTLEDLYYDTYESMTYATHEKRLNKHAVVYLPYGYTEDKEYNVYYLMHGGWSNETNYLGTPKQPHELKNILDHAIEDGIIQPMIVVCPTYNNESESDSSDYSLALELTDNYHNELVGDLIPAVEGRYSTFASETTEEGIRLSRSHRAFGGFSMGSVATWRTFQYCLDYFRYFMPSSGSLIVDGEYMASFVRDSGYEWDEFFIFAASGTDDFAYAAFKSQIEAMADVKDGTFRIADNEQEGNLYFLEQEGGTHSNEYALEYIYNGMCFLWKNGIQTETGTIPFSPVTEDTTVGEIKANPYMGDFGRLLFPVDRAVADDMTLKEISSSNVYVWYSNIKAEKTVEIVNDLLARTENGEQVFFPIYTEEEIATDASKADTGLFYFKGEPNAKFAITNAGGGFMYVGAMHDSFPHALELSKKGYHAFALIYRPDAPYDDLARAITYIYDHAEALGMDVKDYSLWGGSAGARMAATLGNRDYLNRLTERGDIPQAAAVIMQYTGYSETSKGDAPTYVCVGKNDGIANWKSMQSRLDTLKSMGIPTEFHAYEGLSHGFGLGTDTVAEGWIDDAVAFWEAQME